MARTVTLGACQQNIIPAGRCPADFSFLVRSACPCGSSEHILGPKGPAVSLVLHGHFPECAVLTWLPGLNTHGGQERSQVRPLQSQLDVAVKQDRLQDVVLSYSSLTLFRVNNRTMPCERKGRSDSGFSLPVGRPARIPSCVDHTRTRPGRRPGTISGTSAAIPSASCPSLPAGRADFSLHRSYADEARKRAQLWLLRPSCSKCHRSSKKDEIFFREFLISPSLELVFIHQLIYN